MYIDLFLCNCWLFARIQCIFGMAERPFPVSLFLGGRIEFDDSGSIKRGGFSCRGTIIVKHRMSYDDLVDHICEQANIDRKYFHIKIVLACDYGHVRATPIQNDSSLEVLFYLAGTVANFWAELFVEMNGIGLEYKAHSFQLTRVKRSFRDTSLE